MSDVKFELSRVNSGSLITPFTSDSGEDSRMGRAFRRVFAAEHCRQRKVYWVERAINGKIRLRQVLKLDRTRKSEDRLIQMLPKESGESLIRLAIANANQGQWLTGIRWELYEDFECTKMISYGRFDHFDLFPVELVGADHRLIGTSQVTLNTNVDAWDYDGLVKGHTCPGCNKMGIVDFLIYQPEAAYCGNCSKNGSRKSGDAISKEGSIAILLLQRFLKTIDTGIFPAVDLMGEQDDELAFLDFRATPLLCWVLHTLLQGKPLSARPDLLSDRDGDHRRAAGFSASNIMLLYHHSIFPILRIPEYRKVYCGFVERVLNRYKKPHEERPHFDWDPSIVKAMFDSWDREAEENAIQDLQIILHLEEWLESPYILLGQTPEEGRENEEKAKQVRRMSDFYALTIEEMLDVKAEEMFAADKEQDQEEDYKEI